MHKKLREVFLALVKETTPGGQEDTLAHLLPPGTERDEHGNYVLNVGDHKGVMFSSHLDNACTKKGATVLGITTDGMLGTDGTTILGADCKTGAAIMICMALHGVPGHYVWHAGEESGGIGSRARAKSHAEWYRANIRMCVALDRKDYGSVITTQNGIRTCSDEFANSLIKAFGFGIIDTGGFFTDSRSYAYLVEECTNLSVGYFNMHTINECQSVPYMHQLLDAMVNTDWGNLTVARVPVEPVPEEKKVTYTTYGKARKKDGGESCGNGLSFPSDAERSCWDPRGLLNLQDLGGRWFNPEKRKYGMCFVVKKRRVLEVFNSPQGKLHYLSGDILKSFGSTARKLSEIGYGALVYDPVDDVLFISPQMLMVFHDVKTNELVYLDSDHHVPTMNVPGVRLGDSGLFSTTPKEEEVPF